MNLTKTQKDALVEEATNSLMGHCAMESVTNYIVSHINKDFGTEFKDTSDLLEFIQEEQAEITECPACGWYVECLTIYAYDDDEEIELEEAVCDTCAQYN